MSLEVALSLLSDARSGLAAIERHERDALLPGEACGRIDDLVAALETWPVEGGAVPRLSAEALRRTRRLQATLRRSVDRLQSAGFDGLQLDGVFRALLTFEEALEREGNVHAEAVSDAGTLLRLEVSYVLTAPGG
jgi:hypothetical protein